MLDTRKLSAIRRTSIARPLNAKEEVLAITRNRPSFPSVAMSSSVMPSANAASPGSVPTVASGSTAIEGSVADAVARLPGRPRPKRRAHCQPPGPHETPTRGPGHRSLCRVRRGRPGRGRRRWLLRRTLALRRCRRDHAIDRRDEAVPATRQCLHQSRVLGRVAQGAAELVNRGVEAYIEFHERTGGPNRLAQVLPRHYFAGVLQ